MDVVSFWYNNCVVGHKHYGDKTVVRYQSTVTWMGRSIVTTVFSGGLGCFKKAQTF